MRKISRLKQLTIFISTIIIILLVPVTALAQSANETSTVPPTKLSLLKVSFWPEYDRQSVLGIYKGELKNSASVPATVKILIPKGAKVSSTAAIDPDGKFQYDRAWATHKVTPGTDYDILTYETIYPRFQTELYYQQLGTDKQRNLNLTFKTSMVSDNLQVEIQKPLRATDFKITPSTSNTADNEGFTYYLYNYKNPEVGQETSYTVSYKKDTNQPSTNGQNQPVSPTSRSNTIIGILAALVLIGGGIGAAIWRAKSVNEAQKKKTKSYPTAKYGKKTKKKHYCADCGAELKKKDKFCPSCGKPV